MPAPLIFGEHTFNIHRGKKEGDISWAGVIHMPNESHSLVDEEPEPTHTDTAQGCMQNVRADMHTRTSLYGNVGNWPLVLLNALLAAKKHKIAGNPFAVTQWCSHLQQYLGYGEAILSQAYMIMDGEISTGQDARYFIREVADLLGTLHHGVACVQTHIIFITRENSYL